MLKPSQNPYANQAWQGSRSSSRKATVVNILVALLIAFPLSVAVFVLEEVAINILQSKTPNDVLFIPMSMGTTRTAMTPININTMSTDFIIAVSIVTGVLACFNALAFWELRDNETSAREGSHQRKWAWTNLIVTLINLAIVAICLGVTSQVQKNDGKPTVLGLNENATLRATRETWLCIIADVKGQFAYGEWAKVGCGFAAAGRYMLIPLLLASVVLMGCSMWQVWKKGGLGWLLGRSAAVTADKEVELDERA